MDTPTTEPKLHPARHAFSLVGLTIFAIVIVGAFVGTAFLARTMLQSGQMAAVVSATLVDLTNSDRAKEDIGTLKVNPLLVEAAQAKADDMAEKGYFAHNSPDGIDPWFWMHEAGYNFSYAGENLAVNFSDSENVERAWMKSPGHRENILNSKFTEIGIATAVGEYQGKKTVFVVQMFGTPRATIAQEPVRTVVEPVTPEEPVIVTTEPEEMPVEEETGLAEALPEPTVAAAEANTLSQATPRYANEIDTLAASPVSLLRVLYILCAGIILVALILTTRFEWKRHHLRHVVAASFLLVLMGGLFAFADWYVFMDPQVGQESTSLERA